MPRLNFPVRCCQISCFLLVVAVALSGVPAISGQGTTQEWQAQAVQKYPALGVSGSALNTRFIAAVAERRRTRPGFFADPRWPILLADELAAPVPVATPVAIVSTPPPVAPALPPAQVSAPAPASSTPPVEFDTGNLPKGCGLTSAKFCWWSPPGVAVRGVCVLLAGRNGDSRGMTGQKDWQTLAAQERFGLMGSQLVNPPDDTSTFQEDPNGTISDLLNRAVNALLAQAGQKLKDPPLAMWGHSAGGNITQHYLSRHANRVVGAVLVRATAGPGALAPGKDEVPTLVCVGGKDKPDWVKAALNNYDKGHHAQAEWTLALDPREGHEVGRTQPLAIMYLTTAIDLRLPMPPAGGVFAGDTASAPAHLVRLGRQSGWLGDPKTYDVAESGKYAGQRADAVWLPDANVAKAWQVYLGVTP